MGVFTFFNCTNGTKSRKTSLYTRFQISNDNRDPNFPSSFTALEKIKRTDECEIIQEFFS